MSGQGGRRRRDGRVRAPGDIPAEVRADPAGERPSPPAELERLYHELRVHQVELEQQNEELREARAKVEAGLRRYSDLYDFAPVGYLTLAADGTIDEVNLAGATLLGAPRALVRGRRLHSFLRPGTAPVLDRYLAELVPGGTASTCELDLALVDGTSRLVHVTGAIDEASGTSRVALVDVTERRAAESALAASEAHFRAMFEEAPLGVALTDSVTGRIREANERYAEIVRRTREELTTVDWMSITHPDDVAAEVAGIARLTRGGTAVFRMEKRYLRPDGSVVWTGLTVTPVRVGDPEHPRHLSMIEDITERKAVADELLRSRAELAEAQRIAHVGSWSLDRASGRTHWSAELSRIYGLVADGSEPPRDDVARALGPETVAAVESAVERTLATGAPFELEFDIVRPDGSRRHLVTHHEALRDPAGTITGVRGTSADVTEEHERREGRARRLAQRADYLARAEHTLRTNLSVVEGWADLLVEQGGAIDDETRARGIAAIGRNAALLADHVKGLMDEAAFWARAEAIEPVAVDVAAIAAGVVADYVGPSTVGSITSSPPTGVMAMAGPSEIDTVLRHLIENAVRLVGPDGNVAVTAGSGPHGAVELVVRDDGPGLPHGIDIFAAYAKADGPGHGLGLHVVRTLVEAMGGTVAAHDRDDGPGAEFVVTLSPVPAS